MIYESSLYHHGIKGMKWGVRRFQNKDGSLTSNGRKRYRNDGDTKPDNSERNKKIAKAAIGAATVAAAAFYVRKNPDVIARATIIGELKVRDASRKAIEKGKQYVNDAIIGAKDGFREGIKEAPKKATKAVVTGIVMNQTKKALDSAVGKEESAKIFQANDGKKIGKFWKTSPDDKDDD